MFEPEPRAADVVIVGLGASGALAGSRLAAAGLDVVGLDAGERFAAGQFTVDELANDRRQWTVQGKTSREIPTSRASAAEVAEEPRRRQLMMNAVGGTKLHSGCGSYRFLPWHFRARSATIDRYGLEALPVESTVADWPFGYQELEPYYDKVEKLYGVSGQAGNVGGQLLPGGNPFEGPRSGPFPMPPLRRSGWTEHMAGAARSMGWHPYPASVAVNSVPYNGRPACTYCGNCTHNGCWVDAKGLAMNSALPEAEASGHLRVVTGARVMEITTDAAGRATGVVYIRANRRVVQRAAVVLLASYVYENVRLLLLSRSSAHPDGLANRSGQVGRHFTSHAIRHSYASFGSREMNTWGGASQQATAVDDFNGDNFDHSGLGFIGGGRISAVMEKKILPLSRQSPPELPRWGSAYKRWLAEEFRSVGAVLRTVDELPQEHAVMDLDPTHTDPEGLPVVRVTRSWTENDLKQNAFLKARIEDWLRAAGAERIWHGQEGPWNVSAHAFGGTRGGEDPNSSVVDGWGFAHEVANLGILGPGTFASASGFAPVLTIEATAWRSADHLISNWDVLTR